ncbi:VWA domain-containing protein [Dermacoccaceae bacterium W4C1]
MSTPAEQDRDPAEIGSALGARLVEMARTLRIHGVAIGTSEIADAARVVNALGLEHRERLRSGLAAAFLRRTGQRTVFDQAFDLYFPAALGDRNLDAVAQAQRQNLSSSDPRESSPMDDAEAAQALREELAKALAAGDARALDQLAALALERLGRLRLQPGFSAAQALDRLAPQTAIVQALAHARDREVLGDGEGGTGMSSGGGAEGSGGGAAAALGERLAREEMRSRVAAFRRRVETEARRRNAEARGRERIAQYAVQDTEDRADFLRTAGRDQSELRATVAPLAKKLAARLAAEQRRADRGRLDLRATLRTSLSTGGIPLTPRYRHRRPRRPDLVLLCDVSGSVAGFSSFTMALMQALSSRFRRLRVFAFVSTTDEITDLVTQADRLPDDVVTTALRTRTVLGWGASSSYGQALDSFTDKFMDAVGPRTTVLILGDARSNHGLPRVSALREIRDAAARVIWLNPEPASSWDTGDSIAGQYSRVVDMHECRNVAQLRQFVTRDLVR